MKYIGTFKDIDNNAYTVQIITSQSEVVTSEIVLAESAFKTEMDQSDDNIYKPVKYQSATVSIVTKDESDYMFNLYSGSAKHTEVKLLNSDNELLWGGYATPVVYNNGYTAPHEILELEVIDGLSILQYFPYKTQEKQIKSIIEILTDILQICEIYDEFYISSSIKLTSNSTDSLINNLYISEQNFFDEKEDNETDDDVAWTCQEVLEEICQYLGVVCIAEGNKVFFIDLDAIKNNQNGYWKYNIGETTYSSVTLSEGVALSGNLYRGTDSTISLDNVYNKVSIKDDFYTFEDIIPDIYDTAQNITKDSDTTLASSSNINNGMYGEVVQGVEGNSPTDTNNNIIIMIDRVYDPQDEVYTDCNAVFVKYFKHPYYRFYSYGTPSNESLNYTDTKNMHGAIITKFYVKKLEKTYLNSWMAIITGNPVDMSKTLDDWMAKNEISSVSFSNYIMMLNPHTNHITNEQITQYPYFETTGTDFSALFGGDKAFLVIQGSYSYHYMSEDPYPIPEDEVDISEGRYSMDAGHTYLLCKLQWGDKYWDGTKWDSSNKTFKLPYMRDDASGGDRRADATMFKDLDFVNTVTWRMGVTEKGYMIPLPEGKIMSGMPKLTVYKPFDPNFHSEKSGDNEGQHYRHTVVFLKNFAIKAVIGDPTYSDVNDTDTIYTNVIDNNSVNELDEIKFKICTNDGKKPNYSSVAYKDSNNEYHFLDTIYNSAMISNGIINNEGNSNNGDLRAEEWLIHRLTNQYSEPKVRLELQLNTRQKPYAVLTDKWLPGKKFIVDSQSTDYVNNQTTITLVEKG